MNQLLYMTVTLVIPAIIAFIVALFWDTRRAIKENRHYADEGFICIVVSVTMLACCVFGMLTVPTIYWSDPELEEKLIPVSLASSSSVDGRGSGNFLYSRMIIDETDYISFYYRDESGLLTYKKIPASETKVMIVDDPNDVAVEKYVSVAGYTDRLFGWDLEAIPREAHIKESYVVKVMKDQFSDEIWIEP